MSLNRILTIRISIYREIEIIFFIHHQTWEVVFFLTYTYRALPNAMVCFAVVALSVVSWSDNVSGWKLNFFCLVLSLPACLLRLRQKRSPGTRPCSWGDMIKGLCLGWKSFGCLALATAALVNWIVRRLDRTEGVTLRLTWWINRVALKVGLWLPLRWMIVSVLTLSCFCFCQAEKKPNGADGLTGVCLDQIYNS